MKTIQKFLILAALIAFPALAQTNSIVATTTGAAMTAAQTYVTVASTTGINAPTASVPASQLYIVDPGQKQGELVVVTGAASGLNVPIRRSGGNNAKAHVSGAMVLIATKPNWFYSVNPWGACTTASTDVTPWVNTATGDQWLCSSKTLSWVPSWGTANSETAQILTATATASVAGATAIAGPLVEISGTEAITSFTMSTGWNGQGFCVYPTAAFTTVAGNNIAEASTADANQILCFVYNANAAKFSPTY